MKLICFSIALITSIVCSGQSKVSAEDLKAIIGNWEGTITYIDYQSNQPFSMSANLNVEKGKDGYTLILNNIYPNEPKANDSEKVKLSKDGSRLNKHEITSRIVDEKGGLVIQTEHEGKDDNKDAIIRYTYSWGNDSFIIRKEVQFNDAENWIKRSEYSYVRAE